MAFLPPPRLPYLFKRRLAETLLYYLNRTNLIAKYNFMAKETFGDIIKGDKPVLVDFTAEWCGPCKMMKPILDELHKMMGDGLRILKIDVDRNPAAASSLNVSGVPTLMLYQKGQLLWRQSGVQSAKQLQSIINQKASVS